MICWYGLNLNLSLSLCWTDGKSKLCGRVGYFLASRLEVWFMETVKSRARVSG